MNPESTDTELLLAIRAGGRDRAVAWPILVRRLSPRMFAVARSFRFDAATCEDLVQTAWLRLIDRHDQISDPSSVRAWLCMVVRNEARKIATRTRTTPVGEGWELAPDERLGDPEGDLMQEQTDATLRSAFAQLGDECRQIISISLVDPPLSYGEIAAAVGRPRGSIGPTRRRCLERLKSMLPDWNAL